MNQIYWDTNVFVYQSTPESPYFHDCLELSTFCLERKIFIQTSVETIQEIVHIAQKQKLQSLGLQISNKALKLINSLHPVTEATIQKFLSLAQKYPNITSRDLLHVAVCLENGLPTIITYDKEFKKISEIKSFSPEEYVKFAA